MIEISGALARRPKTMDGDDDGVEFTFYCFENSPNCGSMEQDGTTYAYKLSNEINKVMPGRDVFKLVKASR